MYLLTGTKGWPTKEETVETMIEVELRQSPEGAHEYRAVARLTVRDDGTHETWDPEDLIPFELHALRRDPEAGLEKIHFEDQPAEWARRLGTILRTGYLVPVIVRDDEVTQTDG